MNGRGDDGRGSGPNPSAHRWWWWIPVAAIAVVVAFLLLRGDGEPEQGPAAVPETPSLEPAEPGQAETGTITIGGEPAAELLEAGSLGDHADAGVLGTAVSVDSVIADGVYWVGEGRAQLLLVEPEGQERQLAEGDAVTFRGTVRELDDEVRSAVWGTEAEQTVEEQGVYVAVDELATAAP